MHVFVTAKLFDPAPLSRVSNKLKGVGAVEIPLLLAKSVELYERPGCSMYEGPLGFDLQENCRMTKSEYRRKWSHDPNALGRPPRDAQDSLVKGIGAFPLSRQRGPIVFVRYLLGCAEGHEIH